MKKKSEDIVAEYIVCDLRKMSSRKIVESIIRATDKNDTYIDPITFHPIFVRMMSDYIRQMRNADLLLVDKKTGRTHFGKVIDSEK
jgi:hypothetical protein